MGRRKLEKNQLIENKKIRSKVFAQRKERIMKKAMELSTLCNIPVGVIIYGPDGDLPNVWPKDCNALNKILCKYQKSGVEERRKSVSCSKGGGKKDCGFMKNNDWKGVIEKFSTKELVDLVGSLETKINAVYDKINLIKCNDKKLAPISKGVESCGGRSALEEGVLMKMSGVDQFNLDYDYDYDYDYGFVDNNVLNHNMKGFNYNYDMLNVGYGYDYVGDHNVPMMGYNNDQFNLGYGYVNDHQYMMGSNNNKNNNNNNDNDNFIPKLKGVIKSTSVGAPQGMMMNDVMLHDVQHGQYRQHLEQQVDDEELMMMMGPTMMMNGNGCSNFGNKNVGDLTGLMGVNYGAVNTNPITCSNVNVPLSCTLPHQGRYNF